VLELRETIFQVGQPAHLNTAHVLLGIFAVVNQIKLESVTEVG
jgi:hypothetical protein